jgi:hypothetical protein
MYWYLKNLRYETISRNYLDEISRNPAKFRETKHNEILRNKKILFRDHPSKSTVPYGK